MDNNVDEKGSILDEVENVPSFANLSPEDAQWLAQFPEARKKAVVRKVSLDHLSFRSGRVIDLLLTFCFYLQVYYRLIPLLTLLYLFSFIDRANIGTCKV